MKNNLKLSGIIMALILFLYSGQGAAEILPQGDWRLFYVDSEELVAPVSGAAVNVFDGNANTKWHTEWYLTDPDPGVPHEIQIDLSAVYELYGFRYLPRQDGLQNGWIDEYAFYVSLDGVDWGTPVVSGSFSRDSSEKEVSFPPVAGRYIRLVALSEVNGNRWSSIAELNVLGDLFSGSYAPNGTIDTPLEDVTITAGETVNFTGSGSDPDNDLPLAYLWDFGDAGISEDANPGQIRFSVPGTYVVTFTVTDALGNSDPTPASRVVEVLATPVGGLIPQDDWRLFYVDSEEVVAPVSGAAVNVFDGNANTKWHTEWYLTDPDPGVPHEIQIDLSAVYELYGFRYLPRQDGLQNGWIDEYAFYVSLDGVDWGIPVVSGSFSRDSSEKEVSFPPVAGRYIRLVALSEINGNRWSSIAELNVLGDLFSGSYAPNGTIDTPLEDVTITAGETVSFTGSGSDPDNDLPLAYLWDFGDAGISEDANPGQIRFSVPGTYVVTFTVTDALGNSDPTPASRVVEVLATPVGGLIPQDDWRLFYVDSEEVVAPVSGAAVNAFDGNANTKWHTEWYLTDPDPGVPHEIQIDLSAVYELYGFRYLPRQDGLQNGWIDEYAFYVSLDGVDWGTPVVSGSFSRDSSEKEVSFPPVAGRYIRLVALSEINGNRWSSIAELNVLGDLFSGSYAPNGTIDTPLEDVTITAGETVSFTGSGSDPDNDLPLAYLWDFGDAGISEDANPGQIRFSVPGTYVVTFTVTDALGNSDPTPASRVVEVLATPVGGLIPQDDWRLFYVDSEEVVAPVSGAAVNAFDGNASTKWHTEWYLTDPDPGVPHEIQIDLSAVYELYGFRYLPRQDGLQNGWIGSYAFYVSLDGVDWGIPVVSGSFSRDSSEKEVSFPPVAGRYIRLVALSEINGNRWSSIAELNMLGGPSCELPAPSIRILSPQELHIQSSNNLLVLVHACLEQRMHDGWGVKVTLNGTDSVLDYVAPYEINFVDLTPGEYSVEAVLVNEFGDEIVTEATYSQITLVGIGEYYIAIGDSITSGYGDDYAGDDESIDGRNSGGGFTPLLNNALTSYFGIPHYVANEGMPGARVAEGLQNIPAIMARHQDATRCLVMFGTNDANPTSFPVPSGKGLGPLDIGYPGTFKTESPGYHYPDQYVWKGGVSCQDSDYIRRYQQWRTL